MKMFRFLLSCTAMLLVAGGPLQGRAGDTPSRSEPPDIWNADMLGTSSGPVGMEAWTTGYDETRTDGTNAATNKDELVKQPMIDMTAATGTDPGLKVTESDNPSSTAIAVEATENSGKNPVTTEPSTTEGVVEATEDLGKNPAPTEMSSTGVMVEATEDIGKNPATTETTTGIVVEATEAFGKNPTRTVTSSTGSAVNMDKSTAASVDNTVTGTALAKSADRLVTKKSEKDQLNPTPKTMNGSAKYPSRLILLFVITGLILLPMKTTAIRLASACGASTLAFCVNVIFAVMVNATMLAVLIVENQKSSGPTVITDIICSRIGTLWCILVFISVLAGFATPLARVWKDWLIFARGLSGDLAFVAICYIEHKHQLLNAAQEEALKTVEILVNWKTNSLSLGKDDFIFILMIYFFINCLLEYARKRDTGLNSITRRKGYRYDAQMAFREMVDGRGHELAFTVRLPEVAPAAAPVPKPEFTVIDMEEIETGDN